MYVAILDVVDVDVKIEGKSELVQEEGSEEENHLFNASKGNTFRLFIDEIKLSPFALSSLIHSDITIDFAGRISLASQPMKLQAIHLFALSSSQKDTARREMKFD